MKVSRIRLLVIAALLACDQSEPKRPPEQIGIEAGSSARLALIFRHLDTVLTVGQRAALRRTVMSSPTDSTYQFMLSRVADTVGTWPPSLSVPDSLVAAMRDWHLSSPEDLSGVGLDAYVQHLNGTPPNMLAVLARVPPAPRPSDFQSLPSKARAPAR